MLALEKTNKQRSYVVRRCLRTDVDGTPLIVPGSASFPAMASLGRRSLPAPRSCALFTCVVPDSDPDLFPLHFLLFYFLAFLPISLIAHHVRSSPLPFRLNATARPRPCSTHMLGFLAHMYVWFTLSPLLAFAFYARFFFWLHSPSSLFLSPFHYQHLPRLCLCALRQGLPLASNSGTHIHPLRRSCTCASPATPSRDSYLLSRRHHRCRRSSPEASWVLAGSLKHTRINGANASLPSVHNITICILFTNDFFTLIDFQTKTVYPSSHPSSFHIHALQIHNIIYYIHTYIPHCEKKVILPGFLEKTDSLYGLLLSHVLSCYE